MSSAYSFRLFARHIATDATRFRHAYNSAVQRYRTDYKLHSRSHPVPDLTPDELPFWVVDGDTRRPATTADRADTELLLRPRALTLTLFARLCLGDLFVHGIGGGKYDEVADTILRDYFGLEPPAYQVMSATLHLPLPSFPATTADVNRLHRIRRELDWETERHIDPREASDLKRRKQELIADRSGTPAERRQRYRELQTVKERLRDFVGYYTPKVDQQLARARAEVAANAILRRRDYSWVLYPEATLKPFLQQFL